MTGTLPSGDHPITNPDDDRLGRVSLARELAREILAMDASRGAIVGISGGWGTGKTSLLNLCLQSVDADANTIVVDFNPWLFSGVEQLTGALLDELSATLATTNKLEKARDRLNRAAEGLGHYADALKPLRALPLLGTFVGVTKDVSQSVQNLTSRDKSLTALRNEVSALLSGVDQRIVVAVDDIDRLTKTETRDLFRAVRLTAQFPNVVYVLCLDQSVVAKSLTDDGFDGDAYLEKILTLTVQVPEPGKGQLLSLAQAHIRALTSKDNSPPLDEPLFAGVLNSILLPLVKTPRDIKRATSALPLTIRRYENQLPVADLVALEALRVLRPKVHLAIVESAGRLTEQYGELDRNTPIDELLTAGTAESDLVLDVVRLLFGRVPIDIGLPGFERTVSGVDTPAGMWLYVSGQLPHTVAIPSQINGIITAFQAESSIREALEDIGADRLMDTLRTLCDDLNRVPADQVSNGVGPFLELVAKLANSQSHSKLEVDFALRCTSLLLRNQDPHEAPRILTEYIGEAQPLYPAVRLAEALFIEEDPASLGGMREQIKQRILDESTPLDREEDLLEMLLQNLGPDPSKYADPLRVRLMSPRTSSRLLALAAYRHISVGDPRKIPQPDVHWKELENLYGGTKHLAEAIGAIDPAADELVRLNLQLAPFDVLALARSYLGLAPLGPSGTQR